MDRYSARSLRRLRIRNLTGPLPSDISELCPGLGTSAGLKESHSGSCPGEVGLSLETGQEGPHAEDKAPQEAGCN